MAVYTCISNIKVVQTVANVARPNQVVTPLSQNSPNSPAAAQSLQVVVTGNGSCAATVQFVGSNDGLNWINYGSTVAATGATADITPGTAATSGIIPWTYIGAFVTAISGTNAAATATVSA